MKELLDNTEKLVQAKNLRYIFNAIFYNHVDFETYLNLRIKLAECEFDKVKDMGAEDFKDSLIVFVDAGFEEDITAINMSLFTGPEQSLQFESNAVIPILQKLDTDENIINAEPLIYFLLVNSLTPEGLDILELKFDLYNVIDNKTQNTNKDSFGSIEIDADKIVESIVNKFDETENEPD